MKKWHWDFRDVSVGVKMVREFLLGRPHTLHARFPPQLAPRTIPPPDIPRGPEYKYSNQYYFKRSPTNAVEPPVVAPIAEGPPVVTDRTKIATPGGITADSVCFLCAPAPGLPWWWDGHCYYECVPDTPTPSPTPPSQSICQPTPGPPTCPKI